MLSVILKQTGINSIPHSDEERLIVWAQRDPGDLPEEVYFLPLFVIDFGVVDVNKVSRLGDCQKLAIG